VLLAAVDLSNAEMMMVTTLKLVMALVMLLVKGKTVDGVHFMKGLMVSVTAFAHT
jgi:hypothetical protein